MRTNNSPKRDKFRSPTDGDWFQGYASAAIEVGDIVRVASTTPGGAYFNLTPALGDGSQKGKLGIAVTKAAVAGRQVWFKWYDSLELDTSTAALGDSVYVSDSVAGALTLSPTLENVGWVSEVGTSGRVFIDPSASEAAASGGSSQIVLLKQNGGQQGYSTIQAAMNDAGASETVLVYPGTYAESIDFTGLAAGVRVTGFPNAQNVIITGADTTGTRVTLSQTGTLRELTVVGPSSGANPAIDCTSLPAGNLGVLVDVVCQGANGSGPLVKGAGSGILVSLQGLFHNGGATTGAFIEMTGGTAILQQVIANVGSAADILKMTGGTVTCQNWVVQPTAFYNATDGFELGGGSLTISDLILPPEASSGITNALHVTADGVTLSLQGGSRVSSASGGYDLLVDGALAGTGSDLEVLSEVDFDKLSIPSGYRDVAETRLNYGTQTGWANYNDDTHTSGSPQALVAATRTQWTNDGGTEIVDYRPGKSQLWSGNKIQAQKAGEAYEVRIQFTIDPAQANAIVDIEIDIGSDPFGASSIPIVRRSLTLGKGTATQYVSMAFPIYCLGTFVANGGAIAITSSVNADIYDKSLLILRIH